MRKMLKLKIAIFLVLTFFTLTIAHANSVESNRESFDKVFYDWTNAFNQKDLELSCGLFSKKVVANYQGVPQKDYKAICNGFKKTFKEKNRDYHYRYKLHDIYTSGDLAAVRITWYLTVYETGKVISEVQDEGIDILEKNKEGSWQIVNYIAFPEKFEGKV